MPFLASRYHLSQLRGAPTAVEDCSAVDAAAARCLLAHLAVLALIFGVQIGTNQTGADYTSPVLLAILFNTDPISSNLISSFLVAADRLTPRRVTGLAVAFGGVAWILTPRTESSALAPNPALGNALVLAANTLLSIRMVYTRQLSLKVEYVKAVFWTLVGALPVFLVGWVTIADPMERTAQD